MNKKLFMAASVLVLSGMLAACGTDDSSEDTTQSTATENQTTEKESATSEGNSADESTEEEFAEEETTEEDAATEDSTEPAEENPVVTEGTLAASDSQPYELYLLDGYELTSALTPDEKDEAIELMKKLGLSIKDLSY